MVSAEELKIKLGDRAKNIISQGLNLVEKNKKVVCPLHNDHKPSMSWFADGLMWRCHSCQGTIDIYTYYTEFENLSFHEAMKKVANEVGEIIEEPNRVQEKKYNLPIIETFNLSQEALDYMDSRKITKETLEAWKVKQRLWNNQNVYVFNYYDEQGKLKFVSYRGIGKGAIKGGCEKNTEPILWGMWHTVKNKPLVITEGQPDAMVVWQSGYKNVVSVPNGAKNFKWIDTCWEYLQEFNEIIVYHDNDQPGYEMALEIQRRLKNVKILTHNKHKDANVMLFREGQQAILKMIREKINELPNNLIDVSKNEYLYLGKRCYNGIETGYIDIDKHIEDLKLGEITVLFGRNGEGKSTFISQLISHNLKQKVKTFLFSGELSPQKVQEWQYKQMVGNREEFLRTVKTKYTIKKEPIPEVIQAIKKWHDGIWYLYKKQSGDNFFETLETLAKRYGVKLFVIDNLMTVLEENADSLFSDQANFVQKCKDFAISNNIHLILAAHPNKMKHELDEEAEKGNLDKTDISGSNNIANKADNIISVERLFGENRKCDAIVTVLKDREEGRRKVIKYNFSKSSLRFYNDNTFETDTYGWESDIPIRKLNNNFKYIHEKAPWEK